MYDHQENWPALQAEVLRKNYERLMQQYEQALLAQSEGVFQVSMQSQTVALTITLDGFDIAQEMIEAISHKLTRAEEHMRKHAIDTGESLAWETRKKEMEQEQRVASNRRAHEEYVAQGAALAQQALPTFNTKGPGRPRKAAAIPCAVTTDEVARTALAVPMNSGSTAHAVARATNLPEA